ncbi:MAG: hypothetical protein KF788_08900 [Piscinibacter sp.]|nr:hypothetical protein [Piscinibacter sp.]
MNPVRVRDWQSRLQAIVCRRLQAPFAWGVNDCCLFAADCVLAVTGRDPAEDLRGAYADERGAARLLAAHGGVVELAIARLGPVVPAALAQPGDVGLVRFDGRDTLAVCMGAHWMAPGEAGLATILPGQVLRAWRCEA